MARIDVRIQDGRLVVEPNPVPVDPGGTIEWIFDPSAGTGEMHVGFEEARDPSVLGSSGIPVGPMGPLVSIERLGDRLVGTLSEGAEESGVPWIYHYRIWRNGAVLGKGASSSGEFNGGGVETPRRPPT